MRFLFCYSLLGFILFSTSCNRFNDVKSLYFTVDEISISVGQKDTAELFFSPIESTNYNLIKWTSSNSAVATVDMQGVVTGIYSGSCVITAFYDNKKASIKVDVKPIDFEMKFSKAIAYFWGDYYKNGYNIYILRLLSDGYYIEPGGNVSGAGYYFNAELRLPISQLLLQTSVFSPSKEPAPFTYMPGYIKEEGGNLYAIGAYLGFLSMNSNVASFVEKGSLDISKNNDEYTLNGNFGGSKNEVINISYLGSIVVVDRTIKPKDTITFDTDSYHIEKLGDCYNFGQNIFRIKFLDTRGNALQAEFIAPLSSVDIPKGVYRLDMHNNAFNLVVPDTTIGKGTILIKNGANIAILYGSIMVEEKNSKKTFKIDLVSSDNFVIKSL